MRILGERRIERGAFAQVEHDSTRGLDSPREPAVRAQPRAGSLRPGAIDIDVGHAHTINHRARLGVRKGCGPRFGSIGVLEDLHAQARLAKDDLVLGL